MRRYNSFFVQTWVDDASGGQDRYRLKIEHVQTGAVTLLTDPSELPNWLYGQIADVSPANCGAEDTMARRVRVTSQEMKEQ